ncbi:hypothetical protein IV45_GL001216 [Limosilactobacillus secaliphilus]|uniref:Addiction module antitoxin, RelB/DinJ family n=2 Tax=Limosilactobacillus secaliphilus TaxID=396268 RepID=A0A0R2I2R0_9LACO|nr:hypothetical protein IV45_GL001216 [Limosilactobacillus secaliphilus]
MGSDIMTKTYSIRLDENTRNDAQKIFNDLGMDFSTGIKIYLKQVIKLNGIPFELSNESGLERSLQELKNGDYKSFKSVDKLFEDLNSKDD